MGQTVPSTWLGPAFRLTGHRGPGTIERERATGRRPQVWEIQGERLMGGYRRENRGRFAVLGLLVVGTFAATGWAVGQDNPQIRGQAGPMIAEYRARRQTLIRGIRAAEAGSPALGNERSRPENDSRPPAAVLVVIVGKGGGSNDGRFHQDNDFFYLTGIDQPDAAAILRVASETEHETETLYLPPTDRIAERYSGPRLAPGPDAPERTGFARVAPSWAFLGDLFTVLADRGDGRKSGSVVYLIDPDPSPTSAARSVWISRLIRDGAPGVRVEKLAPRVHEQRQTKSPAEIALLRRAIAATAAAQAAVVRQAAPERTEAELDGAIMQAFRAHGATRPGFPSIVGSGPNATVLHYERNDRTMTGGDLVVVDIGAEVDGYTADITRTYPVGGQFTPRQRAVYQLVLDAQEGAARQVRPGESTIGALNRWVRDFLRSSPLRGQDEEGTEHTMDHFFAHGLGHHLGLDVHDVGDASQPLRPGQVFTIEPGLYLPTEGFGVRIEDDYLVTPTGVEKLSAAIPSQVNEIERVKPEAARD